MYHLHTVEPFRCHPWRVSSEGEDKICLHHCKSGEFIHVYVFTDIFLGKHDLAAEDSSGSRISWK
jgi:hypothetical protein